MELTNKAVRELTALKDEYERKEQLADKKFMVSALDILEAEARFQGLLEYDFVDHDYWTIFTEGELISINFKKLLDYSKKELSLYKKKYKKEELFAIRNMYVLYCLIHEGSHVWQFCGLDDYDEINRYYNAIDFDEEDLYNRLKYRLFHDTYSFERHACIDANRELAKIYGGTKFAKIATMAHMYYLSSNYGILSPVEKTLLIRHKKNDFDTTDIPTPLLIDVGFRLDKDTYKEFEQIIIKEAKGKISYEKSLSLINKL
ncbi:MAG: hypothetical protein J1F35_05225 [Erysipelotrichales bacterium]|nr:hypothetical protein [Erysipelotrichales bacterium]